MFTDQPVTPLHIETLLHVLQWAGRKSLSEQAVAELLQPKTLPQPPPGGRLQAKATISAAAELKLIERSGGRDSIVTLNPVAKSSAPRDSVLSAMDQHVLSSIEVEPYLTRFYSFLLTQSVQADARGWTSERWANSFNEQVFGGQRQSNPFNETKVSAMWRWLVYAGLGWMDPGRIFECNPYGRIRRALSHVFDGVKKLEDDVFIARLSERCPELDGGSFFQQVNGDGENSKACTPGLSQALIELHADGIIRLYGSRDSDGWSIAAGSPSPDETLTSVRIDQVEYFSPRRRK